MRRFNSFLFASFMVVAVWGESVQIISINPQGDAPVTRSSRYPAVSGDGSVIGFESMASLSEEDENSHRDIYLWNRPTEILEKVQIPDESRSNGGVALSRRGQFVAFHSFAQDVLDGEAPRVSDIYILNRYSNRFTLVTFGLKGAPHNGEALFPRFARKRRYLVFTSNATNLVPETDLPIRNVYVYDLRRNKIELVSKNEQGLPANRLCGEPRISGSGRYVAFKSASTVFAEGQPLTNLTSHLYLVDRRSGKIIQVDDESRGFDEKKWVVGSYDMDQHAEMIVFDARPRRAHTPEDVLRQHRFFKFDRKKDVVTPLVAGPPEGNIHSPRLSEDGRFLVFLMHPISETDKGALAVADLRNNVWQVLVEGDLRDPVFSDNGEIIVFDSSDPNLPRNASKGVLSIYSVLNPLY